MANSSNKTFVTQNICTLPSIYKILIDKIKKISNQDDLYLEFVRQFFLYIPSDYLSNKQVDILHQFSEEAFEFFKNKPLGNRKLIINNGQYNNEPAITILLLNDDKSFIVDSINCLLFRLDLHPKFIVHPTFNTTRNPDGNLQNLTDKTNITNESLLFIKIIGHFSEQTIKHLSKQINDIMDLVDQTNKVRPNIIDQIEKYLSIVNQSSSLVNNIKDITDFLHWLIKHDFTFLGLIRFNLSTNQLIEESTQTIWYHHKKELQAIIDFSNEEINANNPILLGRMNIISLVQKNKLIDYILLKEINNNGEYISGIIIIGLHSIKLNQHMLNSIPLLRNKMSFILSNSGFANQEYNYKKLALIIESLPREVIIEINEQDLYCIAINILSSLMSHKIKLFIYANNSNDIVSILIFLPKDNLTLNIQKQIIKYLIKQFSGTLIDSSILPTISNFTYFFINIDTKYDISIDLSKIELDISNIATLWDESLHNKLLECCGEHEADIDIKKYAPIFSADYKNKYSAEEAFIDINYLKRASHDGIIQFNLNIINTQDAKLKIYSIESIPLYTLIPAIENLGFKALDERSFRIHANHDIKESFIYEFILHTTAPIDMEPLILKRNVEEALDKMYQGSLAIDSLSKLIGLAGLTWREVKLVKALTRYLHQTGFSYGKGYVQLTLNKYPKYTKSLVSLFNAKFNPIDYNIENISLIINELHTFLTTISSTAEDKVLRHMLNLIEAMVRTNFYQEINGNYKNYISFKFQSHKILDLPLPLPYAEIFVYANDFEGLHLRGGKVARGGIRLSDRGEDYRTEVLGLMKAQMTKNTIIVPEGSKGGLFVTLNSEKYSSAEYKQKVIICYKNFLRGLLDLTDNVINGQVVFPDNTIRYDDADTYLVVAADKGTATFSDYANEISKEYNFWLNDAFASGGSSGYDHKKLGITAKGAWISVIKHFEILGVDVHKDPITVVGIGDMSGDVFGNGLLRSHTIKLIAAFNHVHIFIDPNPDMETSFKERERLFYLPNSKWSDYSEELISKGGAVFERSAKVIQITSEIKTLLNLEIDEIAPDELIKAILKANVDLIWNGGIGTYVKASTESHLQIGDKSNDNLRCNGNEIKAKVIAEGGNLGCSQLGRIEYSKNGGLLNTDFIDNSAGVDTSDHEVNIKIALNRSVRNNKISLEQRNTILTEMTNEIEELVLTDNYKQTQAITIAAESPILTIEMFSELINSLEDVQLLDRAVEFLPNKTELSKRIIDKEKLTRPELAVLLSYSKIACFNELVGSDILHDKYFEKYLINYFPKTMQKQFHDEIISHQLSSEIICMILTNHIINHLGGVLINNIKKETSATTPDIVKAYFIVCEIFNLPYIWGKVEIIDHNVSHHLKIDMFTELTKIMSRGCSWFIKNDLTKDILSTISQYKTLGKNLIDNIGKLLIGETKYKYEEAIVKYSVAGIDNILATSIASLDSLISAIDIISIAQNTTLDYNEVANIYFLIGDKFYIDWLRKECDLLIDDSYWNRLSVQSLKDDLYDKQNRLLQKITSQSKVEKLNVSEWIDDNKSLAKYFIDFVTQIKLQEAININMLILANKKFETFLRKLE